MRQMLSDNQEQHTKLLQHLLPRPMHSSSTWTINHEEMKKEEVIGDRLRSDHFSNMQPSRSTLKAISRKVRKQHLSKIWTTLMK
mmetsp:Transcript_30337/g.97659  ORF Transcript_30337/g.97659 Transcript_30337/m.97659 type:complete len:84 (-) Transcript_30337:102-353(-)